MKISIIMPSYNQGRYIEAAIRSVLDQSYLDKELIVIDGGSSDETVSILRRYEDQIKYWVSEPDRGQAHALNKALVHVTGDVIGWLNSDDAYVPEAFSKAVIALKRCPEAGMVHGDRLLINEHGELVGWSRLPNFDPKYSGYVIASETAFWRSSKEINLRFREEFRFCMDVDLFLRLYQRAKFIKIDAFLGAFRCYPDNKSSTMAEVCKAEAERIASDYPEVACASVESIPRSKINLVVDLIQHPKTLMIPYLKYRLKKVFSKVIK